MNLNNSKRDKSMTELCEVPEIKDELERKTFSELENLINKRESGYITNAEYTASIGTLFWICSGLVDGNFFEIISEASKAADKDYSFNRTRLFAKEENMVVISRSKTINDFSVTAYSCAINSKKVMTGHRDHTDTNAETEEKTNKLITKLLSAGYYEQL
jgi:hypothetical protein